MGRVLVLVLKNDSCSSKTYKILNAVAMLIIIGLYTCCQAKWTINENFSAVNDKARLLKLSPENIYHILLRRKFARSFGERFHYF